MVTVRSYPDGEGLVLDWDVNPTRVAPVIASDSLSLCQWNFPLLRPFTVVLGSRCHIIETLAMSWVSQSVCRRLKCGQGVVLGRAATKLRSVETQP